MILIIMITKSNKKNRKQIYDTKLYLQLMRKKTHKKVKKLTDIIASFE